MEDSDITKAIVKLRSEDEVKQFLSDIFSPAELKNIHNRWFALKLLSQKENYLDIRKRSGLSSATIAKMSQSLKYGTGILKTVLARLGD